MSAARRIGIFGGSFDPPHLAHVALARAAVTQLGLDELHILPTGQAWHKARALTAASHRLAMARLAFAAQFAVVDDRVRHVRERKPGHREPVRAIGERTGLVPRLPGREHAQLMQAELRDGGLGQCDVGQVRRVERPAEDADATGAQTHSRGCRYRA